MEHSDSTEHTLLDTKRSELATELAASDHVCPRCYSSYDRATISPPDYKCSCGLEIAYPDLTPGGEVQGVLGWLASPGKIVHQRYRVVKLLGRGGFGSTYLVEDQKLSNKRWALKEIPESMYDEHESRILSKLDHPSIPGITDREIADGMVYMVLEFGGSRTLDTVRRAAEDKRVPLAQLAPWVRQLCDVLSYMHAQTPPIVHRDLKPGNVLLDDSDRVMLIDFGIAKEDIASEQTRALGRAVTHGFSPPEQAMGSGTDARSDIYALGATIYYLLTAHRPPGARERIEGIEISLPSTLVPGIPPAIDRALLQSLSLNPNERQQTVEEFGSAFDYDAPTVKTYEEYTGPERTVMVGSAATTHSVPSTAPQKSLKLGADGAAVVLEQAASKPGNSHMTLILAAAALMAVAGGTYWFTRPAQVAKPVPVAVEVPSASGTAATVPPMTAPSMSPTRSNAATVPPTTAPSRSPTRSNAATVAAPVALAPPRPAAPPAPTGPTAMEELMKRRQTSVERAPAAVSKPAKPPARRKKPKPAPVVATAPPAAVQPNSAPAANAWQKANANTKFQE